MNKTIKSNAIENSLMQLKAFCSTSDIQILLTNAACYLTLSQALILVIKIKPRING